MDSLVDTIQGHADASMAGTYRHFTIPPMMRAVVRIPVPTLAEGDDGAMPASPIPAAGAGMVRVRRVRLGPAVTRG